jgi:hypothetical protein
MELFPITEIWNYTKIEGCLVLILVVKMVLWAVGTRKHLSLGLGISVSMFNFISHDQTYCMNCSLDVQGVKKSRKL